MAEEVEIPGQYMPYKIRMERRASAEEVEVPSSFRLRELRRGTAHGSATETDYWFVRRLPSNMAGARITVRHSWKHLMQGEMLFSVLQCGAL